MSKPTVGPKGGTGTPPKVKRSKAAKEVDKPPQMATALLPHQMFKSDNRPRLSIVHNIYHQMPGEQPVSYTTRSSVMLSPGSALLNQVVSIGEDWQPIPVRLPDEVASITLHNLGPDRPPVIPSQEEVEDIQARIIEVAYSEAESPHAQWQVPVGQDMRALPINPGMLRIRCAHKDTKVRIIIAPK